MRLVHLALFTILVSQPAIADYSALLASPTRPTIAEVEREFENIVPSPSKTTFVSFMPLIARLIAELEWAYPGAVYMSLGRDVVLVGDAIDAFYRAHGQPGRAMRINASGQSLNVPRPLIARFMQGAGVDIENLASSRGYILFDGSGYKPTSQSVKILSAVYAEYARLGRNTSDLVEKFAFFNLFRGAPASKPIIPGLKREELIERVSRHLAAYPTSIPRETFASSSPIRGQSEWHSNFLIIQEMPDGSVTAPSPPPVAAIVRANILSEMRDVISIASSQEFLEQVRAHARHLGYEFPIRGDCMDKLVSN